MKNIKYFINKINNFFEKFRHIFIGWTFKLFGIEDTLANRRWASCQTCCKIKNTKLGEICTLCGCVIDAKVRVEDEHCELGRW